MSKARPVFAYARLLALKARATKSSVRLFAILAIVALASAVVASVPSSAKLIEHLLTAPVARTTAPASAAGSDAEARPAISTDKNVYEPGETVTFSGINWTPGETVTIVLSANPAAGANVTLQATADENGSFVAQTTLPDDDGADAEANERAGQSGAARANDIMYTAVAISAGALQGGRTD
ncbi:MAG TPA: hypothetical protein VF525_09135 [Pyrinomonadaceae bacterium]|jgi:hypothetical protein